MTPTASPTTLARLMRGLAAACLLWLAVPARAEEVFRMIPSKQEAGLGDPFDVLIESTDPKLDPAQVIKVEFSIDPEKWEVGRPWRPLSSTEREKEPFKKGLWATVMHGFETGDQDLPQAHVFFRRSPTGDIEEVLATTTTIRIVGVREENSEELVLRDLRDIRDLPPDRTLLYIILGILIALLVIGVPLLLWWLKRRGFAILPAPKPVPPGVWAMAELKRLRESELFIAAQAKPLATELTSILRAYLGRRYEFNALDRTTRETMHELEFLMVEAAVDPLRIAEFRELHRKLAALFDEHDLIKFSKYEPAAARWGTILDEALAFVIATSPPSEGGTDVPPPEPDPTPATPASATAEGEEGT